MSLTQMRLPLFFILFGCLLRLVWPLDMEWKLDEQNNFVLACDFAAHGEWPGLGIMSSAGFRNPGLSIWPFVALAHWFRTPVSLNQAVQWLNVASIFGFVILVFAKIPPERRSPWLWGLALWSVSSVPVVLSRKLWSQCLTPPFFLLLLTGFWNRNKTWGLLLWGIASSFLGQVHMAGFFISASLFLGVVWSEWRSKRRLEKDLALFLFGFALGCLSLWPWFAEVWRGVSHSARDALSINFYTIWLGTAWGLNTKYSLGQDFLQFLSQPILSGWPTYLVALLHLYLLFEALYSLRFWFARSCVEFRHQLATKQAEFYLPFQSIFWGTGILFLVTFTPTFTHYLIPIFPLFFLGVAFTLKDHPYRLKWVTGSQCLITVAFLCFIHQHRGAPNGDFGISYRAQQKQGTLQVCPTPK